MGRGKGRSRRSPRRGRCPAPCTGPPRAGRPQSRSRWREVPSRRPGPRRRARPRRAAAAARVPAAPHREHEQRETVPASNHGHEWPRVRVSHTRPHSYPSEALRAHYGPCRYRGTCRAETAQKMGRASEPSVLSPGSLTCAPASTRACRTAVDTMWRRPMPRATLRCSTDAAVASMRT